MYDEYRLAWANIEGWINQHRRGANAGRDQARLARRKKKASIGSKPKLVAPSSGWRLPDAGRKLRERSARDC
jgi:hypothetical protein